MKVINIKFVVPDCFNRRDMDLILKQSAFNARNDEGKIYESFHFVEDARAKNYTIIFLDYKK